MSPEYQPNPNEETFLKSFFNDVGEEIKEDVYKITLEPGEEHVLAFTENTIVSSRPVIDAVENMLQGAGAFRRKDGKSTKQIVTPYPEEITEELTVRELLQDTGLGRAIRPLSFLKIKNAKKLAETLNEEDGEEKILTGVGIGPLTLRGLKIRVGIPTDKEE